MLYIVATPIGNIRDASERMQTILSSVDFILCEDTRRSKKLLQMLNLSVPHLISCHAHNEQARVDRAISDCSLERWVLIFLMLGCRQSLIPECEWCKLHIYPIFRSSLFLVHPLWGQHWLPVDLKRRPITFWDFHHAKPTPYNSG